MITIIISNNSGKKKQNKKTNTSLEMLIFLGYENINPKEYHGKVVWSKSTLLMGNLPLAPFP